jgi:ethanolaminephosphotransferase
MNLPIINAAAEGTIFVGSLFAVNAIFGMILYIIKVVIFGHKDIHNIIIYNLIQ